MMDCLILFFFSPETYPNILLPLKHFLQIPYCSQSPPKATERETQQHYGDRAAPCLPAAGLDDRLRLQMANVYMSRNS